MALSKHALSKVETVKEYLKISTEDNEYDTFLERQINAVSEIIESYCHRHFERSEYTEKYSGNDKQEIRLNQYPATDIGSIRVDGIDIIESQYDLLAEQGILIRLDEVWQSGRRNIEVNYTAGYILPKDEIETVERTLPYDLEDACIELIAVKFYRRQEDAAGKLSTIRDEFNVRYEQDIPVHIRQILDRYRKVII